jgi:hypothetical protein
MIALLSTAMASAWPSSAGAATVPADEYVQTVCDGIAPLADLADQLGPGVKQVTDAYTAQPSQTTATALREALADGVEQSAQVVDQATETARTAGTPDVNHGAQFAAAIVKHFRNAGRAFHRLAAQTRSIDVGSAARFARDLKRVAKKEDALQAQSIRSSKRDAAFRNAAAPLQPLVVFMTTDADRCSI